MEDSTLTNRSSRPAFHTTICSPTGTVEERVFDGPLADWPEEGLDARPPPHPTMQQKSAMAAHRPTVVVGKPVGGMIKVLLLKTELSAYVRRIADNAG